MNKREDRGDTRKGGQRISRVRTETKWRARGNPGGGCMRECQVGKKDERVKQGEERHEKERRLP